MPSLVYSLERSPKVPVFFSIFELNQAGIHRQRKNILVHFGALVDCLQANGAYPEELSQLGLPAADAFRWDYRLIGSDRYRLSFSDNNQSRTYDSEENAAAFFAAIRGED